MPLTPIIIPRRNIITITNSVNDFQPIPGTTTFIVFQTNNPFFPLNLIGSELDLEYAGAYLKADGSICGLYNPNPVIDSQSGVHIVTLKPDLSEGFVCLAPGTGINPGDIAYMSIGVISPNSYDLGPVGNPNLTVTPPFFAGTLGTLLSWGYINGWGGLLPNQSDLLFYLYDTTGQFFNAFPFDPDFNISIPPPVISAVSDGLWNYTLIDGVPVSGTGVGVWFSKWQPETYDALGVFNAVNYEIILDDALDNTDWQIGLDNANSDVYHLATSNGKNFCVGLYSNTAFITELTVFLFATDMSYYDRYNIVLDGTQEYPIAFIDYDQNFLIISYDIANNISTFAIGVEAVPGIATLSDVISLGCWSPCSNLLYQRS